jgi:hypothetical protein
MDIDKCTIRVNVDPVGKLQNFKRALEESPNTRYSMFFYDFDNEKTYEFTGVHFVYDLPHDQFLFNYSNVRQLREETK